jgi:hypothetical protein
MPLSAEFSVDGNSDVEAIEVAYGATVTLAALSQEFNRIEWSVASTSKSDMVAPTITRTGTPNGVTATFPQVADPGDGLGRSLVVKCTQYDSQGNASVAYRVIGTVNSQGHVPFCADEWNYRNATHGWTELMNLVLNASGGGGGVTDHGGLTGLTDSNDHTWAELVARPLSSYSGAASTAVLADARQHITTSHGSANTFTIPPNASVAFATGTLLCGTNIGAGAMTLTAGAGVTLNGSVTVAQNGWWWAKKTNTNTWQAFVGGAGGSGDIKADGTVPFAADQSMGGNQLTNVGTPAAGTDAATKAYVDSVAAGLNPKPSVDVVATTNIASLSGLATTIDGVLQSTDSKRVLLTAQTTQTQNGPWEVHSGAWTRPPDFAAGSDAAAAFFFVQRGSVYADTGWVCTENSGSAVVDTNNILFAQFSAAGVVVADETTLQKVGNTFSVKTSGVTATQLAPGAVTTAKILDDNVTYAKIQNVSAASRVLLRGSASGAGDVEEGTCGVGVRVNGTAIELSALLAPLATAGSAKQFARMNAGATAAGWETLTGPEEGADLGNASVTITVAGGVVYKMPAGTTTSTRAITLGTGGTPELGEKIVVSILAQGHDVTFINGGPLGGTMTSATVVAGTRRANYFEWSGTDWMFLDRVRLAA